MPQTASHAPFRADHVGSLLRPDAVKAARKAHFEDGTMSDDSLREAENEAIREAVSMQESLGLKAVTNGERAGGLEPLRLLPKGDKRIMPGFVTTKTGELETVDDLKRKFDEAARYVALDQLGIAPQCGFASTEEGNKITPDDQKRKLELVVKTAESIWGGLEN